MKSVIIFLFVFVVLLGSCKENPIKIETQKMTLSELMSTPSFTGFVVFFNNYEPRTDYIEQIRQIFNPQQHKILMFISPSCYQCGRIDSLSPSVAKIVTVAQVPEEEFEIYSMQYFNSTHPYMDIIQLESLPEYWILKNDIPVYNITDSIMNFTFAHPKDTIIFEKYILEGLLK